MLGESKVNLDRLRRLLLSLDEDPQQRDRPPLAYEVGGLPGDRYPAVHELQIEENLQWARERENRVTEHRRRVGEQLRRLGRHAAPKVTTHGHRQPVWCVELSRRFDSLTAAAEFVGRAASNVSQSIRLGVRCGPYHWEHFDAGKHGGSLQHETQPEQAVQRPGQRGGGNTARYDQSAPEGGLAPEEHDG